MNGKQLKNSILQWAIQGKLVPQDASEEPAIELLKRLNPKIKPTTEDVPFEIPKSWMWCTLKDVCVFLSRGRSPKYSEVKKYPVFAQKCNLKYGWISLEEARFLDPSTLSQWREEYKLKTGDVLINSTGTGTVCRVRLFDEKCLGTYPFVVPDSHVTVARTVDDVNSKFILYYISSSLTQQYLEDNLAGSTNQKELYIGILENLLIPLPPLAEQKRIVAKIEELLPLVERYTKAQEGLDKLNEGIKGKLRASILQESIRGKLVPQDASEEPAIELLKRFNPKIKPITEDVPFEVPKRWVWCSIGDIGNVCSARRVHQKDWRKSGIPFYRAREIGKLSEYGYANNELYIDKELYNSLSVNGIPRAGDLMITAVGTLGKVYIVQENDVFYYKDASVICLENRLSLCSKYIKLVIESPFFVDQFTQNSQGTTVGTLTMERFNKYFFPLPPLAEQKRIVAKIEELFGVLDRL